MGLQHVRDPSRLDNSDYGEFCDWVKEFLGDDRSLPHRPEHMVAEQITLANNYNVKLDAYKSARDGQAVAKQNMDNALKALRQKLRWMQIILPTLTPGNDEILKGFGLHKPVPEKVADVKNYADAAWTHWQTVREEQLFAPLQSETDELGAFITAFETARESQVFYTAETAQRQNEMDTARAEHNTRERAIFTWYRGYYQDPQDDYWTQTPWGKAPEKIDDKFPAPGMLMYDQFRNDFSWQSVPEATGYELEIVNKTTQETITIATPNNQKRQELIKGDYAVKVRAVKAASEPTYSKWSGEVLFTIKSAPGLFKYNPGLKELSWDSVAGATMYEVRKGISFTPVYLGPDTKFVLDLPAGQYQFRVRGGDEMANWWSEWSETLIVDV